MSQKPVSTLIVDTNIFLSPEVHLHTLADSITTCQAIIDEVRDSESRNNLTSGSSTILCDIVVDEPDNQSLELVRNAATTTGDISVLAPADLKLVALATKLMQSQCPNLLKPNPSLPQIDLTRKPKSKTKAVQNHVDDDGWSTVKPIQKPKRRIKPQQPSAPSAVTIPSANEESSNEDSEGEWVGPENQADEQIERKKQLKVAVISNDYAVQNLLMHLNIPVISTNGKRINSVKISCLLCSGCKTPTREMDRVFCPKCGNDSLLRVGLVVGRDGVARLPKKFRFYPKLKGTKYPVPLPKSGRDANNLILREEQLNKAMKKVKKSKPINHFSDDLPFFAGGLNTATHSSMPKVGLGINANAPRKKK
ncbi:hypothetical protein P9112_008887 [Eukaryota sp. TZLM1-RC]